MHVAQINFALSPAHRAPQELLWYPIVYVADAVAQTGARVSVVQACPDREISLTHHGVDYHFLMPRAGTHSIARTAALRRCIESLRPDVFHVHGLEFGNEMRALHECSPDTAFFVQDHANRVPRFWRRGFWRRGLALAGAVSFCARAQAEPFRAAGLISRDTRVFEISESSSDFTPGDREAARVASGVHGAPALLWVGHLEPNKDPMTVLDGVSRAARSIPGIQLWCAFGTAPIEAEVRRRISSDERLRDRVHLLGKLPHERMEALMRAADVFVLGSHREGSGCALMEALACGLPPVVTNIASFRALTGDGGFARHWPPGNAQAFCDALLSLLEAGPHRLRADARNRFDLAISFQAIGGLFVEAYAHSLARRAHVKR